MDEEVEQWMKKLEEMKKGSMDLSRDEDLSIGLMNLISLEEHLYFTAMKTNEKKYLHMLNSVRSTRTSLMKNIVEDPKGEEWCISKHLLAASMRFMEVGTKELGQGKQESANAFFNKAFDLYSLFFAINLKMLDNVDFETLSLSPIKGGAPLRGGASSLDNSQNPLMGKISSVIKDIVNCCKEW